MPSPPPLARLLRGTLLIVALPAISSAQEQYHEPLPAIARILEAPPLPAVLISPERSKLLIMEQPGLLPIVQVAAPELRLGGVRINPRNNSLSRFRTFGTMIVQPIHKGDPRRIVIPWHSRVGGAMWSPDASGVAFTLIEEGGVSLWLADASTGDIRMLSPPNLNGAFGQPCRWMPSGNALLCMRIPAERPIAPVNPAAPLGPVVQEAGGQAAGNATYEDLLQNPRDEELFEYYFTSQLVLIPLIGDDRPVGTPGLHSEVQVSPNGQYLLLQTVHRPFSYLVPWDRFPRRTEVWDLTGAALKVVAERGIQENLPRSADESAPGARSVAWRPDAPATLSWVEAQDGGNPAVPAAVRDRIVVLDAPFTAAPVPVADLQYRSREILWGGGGGGGGGNLALVSEEWQQTRRSRTWLVDLRRHGSLRLLFDRSSEDRYGDPGTFLIQPGPSGGGGGTLLLTSKDRRFAFLQGLGASPDGERPFLDRIDLVTGKIVRLWRSEAPYYEQVAALLDPETGTLLTQSESVIDPPNYFVRVLRKAGPAKLTRITSFTDPAPEFAKVSRQLVSYRRADGVELSGTLYLPPGYQKSQGRLPFLIWTSPLETLSARVAPQIAGSPYRFVRPGGASHLFLLFAGYGVLDGAALPIHNKTSMQEVVASAEAAVTKLVALGVADPKQIAVGGPASAALLTADLLAHSDLFRAGIVRSGAPDRTRMPFEVQNDDRSYDEIKAPLLLIHGMAEDSSATFPNRLERLYSALRGPGARVRLVLIPGEAHGYGARESVWEVLYEMVSWLDRYVKGR